MKRSAISHQHSAINRAGTASPPSGNLKSIIYNLKFLCALCVWALASCSSTQPSSGSLHVLATETFLGDIAQNVAGPRLHIDTLLSPGIDPHEFQPAPQDAIKIAQSQVLIVNGLGYETWLTSSLESAGGQRLTIVASAGLVPNPDPSGGHAAADPHLWMNPLNVVRYVQNIRDGLIQADPAGRDVYTANAAAYIAKLNELDAWVKGQVAAVPQGKRLLVTNHDSLGYFAGAYGFHVVGLIIPSVTNEASPSAQQMAGLIDSIQKSGAPAVFLDPSENQNLAQQIASSTGIQVVTDIYVETLSAPGGPAPTYIEMIRHDTTSIVGALR